MFSVLVSREEQVTSEQLEGNAADGPHVSNLVPVTALQDNFRRTVLASADDSGVGLVEQSCSSEVNNPDLEGGRHPV